MRRLLAAGLLLAGCASGPAVPGSTTARSGSLTLSLGSSFVGGQFLPRTTCDQRPDASVALVYRSTGAGTRQLAVTMVDLTDGTVYWVQTGLRPTSTHLVEHVLAPGATEWPNGFGDGTYDGPCQPHGERHTFALTLYALPGPVDLRTSPSADASVATLLAASTDHAEVTATYTRTGVGIPRFGPGPL